MSDPRKSGDFAFEGELPDKQFFSLDEVASCMAHAVWPEVDEDLATASVSGFFVVDAKDEHRLLNLSDYEALELAEIWRAANCPAPPVFPMEQYTADAYILAVARSKRVADWRLGKTLYSQRNDAAIRRAAVIKAYREQMVNAILERGLPALHPAHYSRLQPPEISAVGVDNILITRNDVITYAASMAAPIALVISYGQGRRSKFTRDLVSKWRVELLQAGMTPESFERYAKDMVHRPDFAQTRDALKDQVLADEKTRAACLNEKKPFPRPDGSTLLTEWANKETWSPEEAAYLACGLVPSEPTFINKHLGQEPKAVLGLCGNVFPAHHGLPVTQVLNQWEERWTSKAERPDRERPADFIAWCKRRSIDTTWLRTLEIAYEGPLSLQVETQEQRRARRYQMCIDAGLKMPTDDYARLPTGIRRLAEEVEKVTRQSFAEDIKAHIRKLQQQKS